ncbi:thermolabile L-asparaginase [Penicillium capsulatum]|uniref:Thermolabile L-asparaginase n=1 Tax=Penicillium capsulatum TaxID=69766 RepID=A0A9W9IC62_9EURO|nr:thermolabile L-asparaginase [Penicillium capsulatum]KAJ6135068.1 thermolabile L-asparaginase [Penicillium capsulatum]
MESIATDKDLIIAERGGVIENRHKVHAAIVDARGKLLFAVGDPSRLTLIRSAAKPAQALAVLETGGFHQFGFDDADLALMCASHSSEPRHLSRARCMLQKAQAEEKDLRCGGHPSLSPSINDAWIKNSYQPTAICNNCSGKHTGMIAGTKSLGAGVATYHHQEHPIQQRVKRVTEELAGLDTQEVLWSIDGCNLPAPALPLRSLATMYARFADSADQCKESPSVSTRTQAMSRIFHAMAQHPELVAGDDRFCTVLMQAFQGCLIGKVGADGCYGVGIQESAQTVRLGAEGAVGISVKIEDGNLAILYCAVAEILEQLELGTSVIRKSLESFQHPVISNTAGVVTGHVVPAFQLSAV